MDSNLLFTEYLQKLYKKGSTRVKLLSAVRLNISPHVAETICKTMIEPVIMHCSTIFLGDERQCCKKLQDIQDRAHKIVFGIKNTNTWISIQDRRQMTSMTKVFKYIHGLLPSPFDDTFTRLNREQNTRGNKLNLAIPRIRTEAAKKSFAYQGAMFYNKLPQELKEEYSLLLFKSKLRLYYS